ncbi:HNH endonuclease [Variovorax sp. PAMC 28711]|uniref:HNH endonuclease n=1 Tax=Variovorax sp. PAMC 28711 TaxID=1795631 RepID=UPI00078D0A06|nr:HNH endonuclease [Variovorax sp. PAMC 28711]AMM23186.1 hypothetical protein AX767_01445 [Variovorax sp. PAMC 28711]
MSNKGNFRAASKADKLTQGMAEAIEVGECLEWQGFFGCKGSMPIVKARNVKKARTDNYAVPRSLWQDANGPVPEGKLVYRKCCNNACVLLDHLAVGTRKEWGKHRAKVGEAKHHNATKIALTMAARRRSATVNNIEKARQVRSLRSESVTRAEISRITGVSASMVADIVQGRRWLETGSPFAGLGARA